MGAAVELGDGAADLVADLGFSDRIVSPREDVEMGTAGQALFFRCLVEIGVNLFFADGVGAGIGGERLKPEALGFELF
jgi:hypothetical protein